MSEPQEKTAPQEKTTPVKIVKDTCEKLGLPKLETEIACMTAALGGNPTKFLVEVVSLMETIKAEARTPKKLFPEGYTETERVIAEMLTENTGTHILDSGEAYGRHWQQNRLVKDFRKTPTVFVTVWDDREIDLSINIFHYLTTALERDEKAKQIEKELHEFADRPEYRDWSWIQIMEEFAEQSRKQGCYVRSWNSYNWENLVSQVTQGVIMIDEETGETYVILQIHNGCDVRGGYTKPRVFRVADMDALDSDRSVVAYCKCTQMSTDDCGYHWYGAENEGFPEYWKPEPKKKEAKNWEYRLRCERCKKLVRFDWSFSQ
ncbi:MAG: hypothetical protein QW304_07665 [Thermoproteota archaeon]